MANVLVSVLQEGQPWLLLILMFVGAGVCLYNQRLSAPMWLMALGFLGLGGVGVWHRVVFFLLRRGSLGSPQVELLFLVSGIGSLFAWLVLLVGLALVLSDVRHRLASYERALQS